MWRLWRTNSLLSAPPTQQSSVRPPGAPPLGAGQWMGDRARAVMASSPRASFKLVWISGSMSNTPEMARAARARPSDSMQAAICPPTEWPKTRGRLPVRSRTSSVARRIWPMMAPTLTVGARS
ncbi:hypothetical protein D3C72_1168820 [compost metagenome]